MQEEVRHHIAFSKMANQGKMAYHKDFFDFPGYYTGDEIAIHQNWLYVVKPSNRIDDEDREFEQLDLTGIDKGWSKAPSWIPHEFRRVPNDMVEVDMTAILRSLLQRKNNAH